MYRSDPNEFDLDTRCPKCGHMVRAIVEAGPIYHISEVSDDLAYLICRCPRRLCELMFLTYDRLNNCVAHVFPYPDVSAGSYHTAIPEGVREDFSEAVRCSTARAFKGVVAMCRRAMQRMAIDRGATGDQLHAQINDLFNKGLITKSLHDAATEIRFFGNFGAHPRDDNLDSISREDAERVLRLVSEFMNDLYVRPAETAKLTQKRQNP